MAANTRTVSEKELDVQRDYTGKVCALLNQRYEDKPLACVVTYGCQQNVADSEHIKGMLDEMGYGFTEDRQKAKLVIFNTCAVREHAEDRVYGNVGALKKYKLANPDVIIALCGCMMQQKHIAEKIRESFPFVDLVFGTHVVHRLPELLYTAMTRRKRVFELPDIDGVIAEGIPVKRDNDRKAWLPIMYGCNNFCTYCVVPYVRGRERSRQVDDIVREFRELVADGYKEITKVKEDPPENMKFLGMIERDDMNEVFNIGDVMFLPSFEELFPMTILEAMCAHVPILLRDLDIYNDILFDFYYRETSVDGFIKELERLRDDKDYYENGVRASERGNLFYSKEHVVKMWDDFYSMTVKGLLGGKGKNN